MAESHDNPARETHVASLADPSFDHAHADWPKLRDAYARSRSLADLAKLPRLAEQPLTLWRLRPLSVAARSAVFASAAESMQRLSAVRLGVVARLDNATVEGGAVKGAETVLPAIEGGLPQVQDPALQAEVDAWGGLWVDELGDVIIHRTNLPPRRFFAFPLPLPSALLT